MTEEFEAEIDISINSKIEQAGEKQRIDQKAQGKFILNADTSVTILYEIEGQLVRLEIAPEKTRAVYFGHGGKTALVYDIQMDRVASTYATDQGTIDMFVKTKIFDFDQVDATGSLHIKYELFADKDSLGKFDLTLQFSPVVSTID